MHHSSGEIGHFQIQRLGGDTEFTHGAGMIEGKGLLAKKLGQHGLGRVPPPPTGNQSTSVSTDCWLELQGHQRHPQTPPGHLRPSHLPVPFLMLKAADMRTPSPSCFLTPLPPLPRTLDVSHNTGVVQFC